jgi:plasmid stability protein
MADGGMTLTIDEALAERLKARAEAAGQSVEDFARRLLEEDAAIWDEVDAICDATIANGDGVPLEELEPWMRGWGKSDGPSPPR